MLICLCDFFFFSSRRRHTRCSRDWSSDVCSSDLLSYTFPLEMLGVQNLTLSLTGRNLKTWTNYTGNDPETNLTGPSNGQGLDYFNNPTVRSWIVSLQLDY